MTGADGHGSKSAAEPAALARKPKQRKSPLQEEPQKAMPAAAANSKAAMTKNKAAAKAATKMLAWAAREN